MADFLSFSDQVVVVLGGSNEVARSFAHFLAFRGGKLVLGKAEDSSAMLATVEEIKRSGGVIDCIYQKLPQLADETIKYAIKLYGKVDVLIISESAGRSSAASDARTAVWNTCVRGPVHFVFRAIRAMMPHFRKQRLGRIVIIGDIYDGADEVLCTAVRFALTGLTKTTSLEGAKYNILCNMVAAPIRQMVQPVEVNILASHVAVLAHHSNTKETGSVFEIDGCHSARLVWQRSPGIAMEPNKTFTAGVVLARWPQYFDFSQATYPSTGVDFSLILDRSRRLSNSSSAAEPSFAGKVVVITGAGVGLGRSYADAFSELGASVLINDVVNPEDAVQAIIDRGGKAVGHRGSVEEGHRIIEKAIETFGRIDILINNAGIVRDRSLQKMTDTDWEHVMAVHLLGSYATIEAAWPYMIKQGYGRIVNTTSVSGLYGNFGQANYSTAKAGIIGLSQAYARAGAAHNIAVNTIAPAAGTNMSQSVMSKEMALSMKAQFNAPFVVALCSSLITPVPTGLIFETGLGWGANTILRRSHSYDFHLIESISPEHVLDAWTQSGRLGRDDNSTMSPKL